MRIRGNAEAITPQQLRGVSGGCYQCWPSRSSSFEFALSFQAGEQSGRLQQCHLLCCHTERTGGSGQFTCQGPYLRPPRSHMDCVSGTSLGLALALLCCLLYTLSLSLSLSVCSNLSLSQKVCLWVAVGNCRQLNPCLQCATKANGCYSVNL